MDDWLGLRPYHERRRSDGARRRRERFLPFAMARALVHRQRLRSASDWRAWSRAKRLANVPAAPYVVYATEWKGWKDWLGYQVEHRTPSVFPPFERARTVARELRVATGDEWRERWREGGLPPDLPCEPGAVYPSEWQGWGDFLGTGRVAHAQRVFRPFAEARVFVRALGLRSRGDWVAFTRGERADHGAFPSDLPISPHRSYGDSWRGWGDFLGTGAVASFRRAFRPFAGARDFVRALGLRDQREWQAYSSGALPRAGTRPSDVPSNPQRTYRDEWVSWGDWLGLVRKDHGP